MAFVVVASVVFVSALVPGLRGLCGAVANMAFVSLPLLPWWLPWWFCLFRVTRCCSFMQYGVVWGALVRILG